MHDKFLLIPMLTLMWAHKADRGTLKQNNKDTQTISDYMQLIKIRADRLAALGKPMDYEDLIEKILDGHDNECKSIIDVVNGRGTTILFDELYEKLSTKNFYCISIITVLLHFQPL